MDFKLSNTAVLFVFFKRRDESLRVFEAIRSAQPPRLYLVSDGARANVHEESKIVEELRETIMSLIDWNCEVVTHFRKKNLGCHLSMEDSITWFFLHEKEGIILEDDCLPDPSFFPFCEQMLERYRDQEHVMMISGVNSYPLKDMKESYFFAPFINIWGWATWRRAWEKYDPKLQKWPQFKKEKKLEKICTSAGVRVYEKTYQALYRQELILWDSRWSFAVFSHQGLVVFPAVNLVSNIGLTQGTTTQKYDPFLNRSTRSVSFPLRHPERVEIDIMMTHLFAKYISPRSYTRTVWLILKRWGIKGVFPLMQGIGHVLRQKLGF